MKPSQAPANIVRLLSAGLEHCGLRSRTNRNKSLADIIEAYDTLLGVGIPISLAGLSGWIVIDVSIEGIRYFQISLCSRNHSWFRLVSGDVGKSVSGGKPIGTKPCCRALGYSLEA